MIWKRHIKFKQNIGSLHPPEFEPATFHIRLTCVNQATWARNPDNKFNSHHRVNFYLVSIFRLWQKNSTKKSNYGPHNMKMYVNQHKKHLRDTVDKIYAISKTRINLSFPETYIMGGYCVESTDKGTICFTAKPKFARDLRSFGILRSVEP